MIRQAWCGIYYLVALCAATANANAGSLVKLWEINLRESVKEIRGSKVLAPTVFSLKFSPDGQYIGVTFEDYYPEGSLGARSHLIVVPVRHSNGSIRQFEVGAGVEDLGHASRWPGLHWTASGDAIVAGGELVRLTDRRPPCSVTLGAVANSYVEEGRIARFLLLDKSCSSEENWKFANDWTINDVTIDRALLCVSRPIHWGPQDIVAAETARVAGLSDDVLIVEPFTGKTIQRWPPSVISEDVRFGDGGRVICVGRSVEARGRVPLRCWDVGTGHQIAQAPTINGGTPIAVAERSSRVVASDFRGIGVPFTDDFKEVLRRRVVWDFKSGRELVSWKPELQPYDVGLDRVGREWSAFAISADGEYIAEGGGGILRLYKIEP